MVLKEFKILFDQACAIYHPSETITGKIIVNIDSPKNMRGKHNFYFT